MRPVQVFLEALPGTAKKCGNGWATKCPGHDDRRDSLSIGEGTDGRVLLHCFAGCEPEDIVAAVGLTMGDLFPEKDRDGRREVARYTYHDEAGRELFHVRRYAPKDFRPFRPGASFPGIDGVRRVLFRLPETIEAVKAGRTVFLVEGEKDVLSLTGIGLDATTSPSGAASWRPEFAESLTGARVVVIPDADEAGRKHAAAVKASLTGKAAAVIVAEVPKGKDASDYIASGATREDFEKLVGAAAKPKAAPACEPEAPAESFPWVDLGTFRRELRVIAETRIPSGIPTLDKATEGGISGDTVFLFVGPIGSCKTTEALDLSLRRAKKTDRKVYAYCSDQGHGQPLRRLAKTFGDVVENDDAFERFRAEVGPLLCIVDERESGVTIESFRDAVLAAKAVAAVVIDTPQTVATEEDEEERQRINLTMEIARELAAKLAIPVFVCSHANRASTAARKKEDRALPSSAGLGSAGTEHRAQVHLFMERNRKETEKTVVDVEITKAPAMSGGRFRLLLDPASWTMREVDFVEEEETKKATAEKAKGATSAEKRAAVLKVVRHAKDPAVGVSYSRIREEWGGKTKELAPTLAVLAEDRVLDPYPGPKPPTGGKAPTFYRLGPAAKGATPTEVFPFIKEGVPS